MAAYTEITAATAATTNRFVASTNMANGAYTLANTTPLWASGGCIITAVITGVTGNDTPGTITVVGTDLAGNAQTEVITLVAGGTATGSKVFKSITSITQAGWVINGGNDTIVIGHIAGAIVCGTSGTLFGVIVNTTAAATVTVADSKGTIFVLKTSIAEGFYMVPPGIDFTTWLKVTTTSTNDVTFITTATNPGGV